jgi:hypothetical protein
LPIITDVKTFGQWDWAIDTINVLESNTNDEDNSLVAHCRYKPSASKRLATRDYVYTLSWNQSRDEINVYLKSCTHADAPPGVDGFVRGEILSGGWRVARVAGHHGAGGMTQSIMTFSLFYDLKATRDERSLVERLHELVAVQNGHNLIKLEKHAMHERQRSLRSNRHRNRISHDTPLSSADTSSITTRPRRRSISDGRTRFEYARLFIDETVIAGNEKISPFFFSCSSFFFQWMMSKFVIVIRNHNCPRLQRKQKKKSINLIEN